MELAYRFAVCNEIFRDVGFEESCSAIREIGYNGLEIAPFTLAEDPVTLSKQDRADVRQAIERNRLSFVGLHWLLVSPRGLHATTADKELRRRTWQFIDGLIELCKDLRTQPEDTGVMVLGSPQQRSATDGMAAAEATDILIEELARVAPHANESGVKLLIEPLSASQTNVVNSLAESVRIVETIDSPAIQTMFDVHNAIDEPAPHVELLRQYITHIRHVHVNEMDGREPGSGLYDFGSILATLEELAYGGWVSLEVFDFSRDGREVASRALQHLHQALNSKSFQNI